jgi:hypothetical protein
MVRVSSGEVETMVQISGSILLMDVRRQVDGQADPLHIQEVEHRPGVDVERMVRYEESLTFFVRARKRRSEVSGARRLDAKKRIWAVARRRIRKVEEVVDHEI